MSVPDPLGQENTPSTLEDRDLTDLRDILLRLTFAAHGWDDRLDTVLERLQDELRSRPGLPDLKAYSETLYRALMRAEDARPMREPGAMVTRAFSGLPIPDPLETEWHHALEACRVAADERTALETLQTCAEVLSRALAASRPEPVSHTGWLGSLLGGHRKEEAPEPDFLKATRHRLLELLNQLHTPPQLNQQLDHLRQQMEQELRAEQIPFFLEQITTLIQEIRERAEREQVELEQFLGQLMDRLTHIEGAVEQSGTSTREVFTSRQRLNDEIRHHTREMEAQARNARDLDTLKQAVQERVETIRAQMAEQQAHEQALMEQADRRMGELMERLHQMEQETERLRHQVQEERRQAATDALTGLPNRFAYQERLEQEFARCQRYGTPLSLLIADVDHFKRINDTYGHQSGDKALRLIARELATAIRKTDFIARYGGEEIVILMPETPLEAALQAAEKLRAKVERCGFHFRGQQVTITLSFGISEYRQGDTPEEVFERADQALYHAKHQGRNRCAAE